ncbi:hypothetical protein LEM8419_00170 [Neolewinella maritima]|uniref:DUF2723 domain-containing protein n=1 Tax=Neolewinella maritima TaxID=1383882 RepID=A0ABN8F1D7_9BACT|nr:DUF2723 domain-containing protein [Neolewinella maritima]CAH0998855.1 hypothetical protein LEM8419_00170 [Neolewinella maritima]
MGKLHRLHQLTGWVVFLLTATVLLLSVERTGSLWDVGEFILGAYKLQVVHPPGAPLFLLIGRMFAGLGGLLSDDPAFIAAFVNGMSALCTAFGATFISWATMRMALLGLTGRDERAEIGGGQVIAIAGSGLVAGLSVAFTTSVWFSAVEGEVYAMSFFFTCMTVWAAIRYYTTPRTQDYLAYRWLVFSIFCIGLSSGVHLLSILALPFITLLFYLRERGQVFLTRVAKIVGYMFAASLLLTSGGLAGKIIGIGAVAGATYFLGGRKLPRWAQFIAAAACGVLMIGIIQTLVIIGVPAVWQWFEIGMVNSGLPVHIGILPTLLAYGGLLYLAFRYAHKHNDQGVQLAAMGIATILIAYSVIAVVVIRAEAKTPVNMNNPDNVTSLLPYLNREQYGERSLVYGPQFEAQIVATPLTDRYGLVDGKYEYTNYKIDAEYEKDKQMFFPRMYDGTQGRPNLYKRWMGLDPSQPLPAGRPNQLDNVRFLFNYQIGWMYWRYFMWNFSGRQNGQQGYYSWDESSGNWITGIKFLDELRLGELDELPSGFRNDPSRNVYFLIPFLLGLLGLFWHSGKRGEEFLALLALFVIMGLGIIVYTNQPPNEPRERDYVLVGSFMVFCMWIGMAVPAIYEFVKQQFRAKGPAVAVGVTLLALSAPLLMVTQNWDDHNRSGHTAARDYAHNFLESVDENAILFTYGDNDTYPLWYAQEVEGIRTDVRVVNLSLIAVDWYIDLLRYQMNESPVIDLQLTADQTRGKLRNNVQFYNPSLPQGTGCEQAPPVSLETFMNEIATDKNLVDQRSGRVVETTYSTCNVSLRVDPNKLKQAPWLTPAGKPVVQNIPLRINGRSMQKDELAILDIINSNFYTRPIYFAVTSNPSKFLGLEDYMQLEGLALQLTATRTPSQVERYQNIGPGGIDVDKNYDLIMNTWKWGNFDTEDTYVNTSYAPAIQSMRGVMLRTMDELMQRGDTERALQVGDKYFEAFPDMNFPLYYEAFIMLDAYFRSENTERVADVIRTLAQNTAERLRYYESLDPEILAQSSFRMEQRQGQVIAQQLLLQLGASKNTELLQEVQSILNDYLYLAEPQEQTPG